MLDIDYRGEDWFIPPGAPLLKDLDSFSDDDMEDGEGDFAFLGPAYNPYDSNELHFHLEGTFTAPDPIPLSNNLPLPPDAVSNIEEWRRNVTPSPTSTSLDVAEDSCVHKPLNLTIAAGQNTSLTLSISSSTRKRARSTSPCSESDGEHSARQQRRQRRRHQNYDQHQDQHHDYHHHHQYQYNHYQQHNQRQIGNPYLTPESPNTSLPVQRNDQVEIADAYPQADPPG